MSVNVDALEELKAQLEDHNSLRIELEGSDNVELEITDVSFNGKEILMTVRAVHS